MRVLSGDDVRRAVSMPAAIDAVAAAFTRLSNGEADVPLRTHISTPAQQGISFFMPARLADHGGGALGIKVVSVFPHNIRRAEPSIYALVTLFDPQSGRPLAVLDGTYLTALRTGAASGAATRALAGRMHSRWRSSAPAPRHCRKCWRCWRFGQSNGSGL